MYVSHPPLTPWPYSSVTGFIPVLFAYWRNRRQTAPMLADDEQEDEPGKIHRKPLDGWKPFLFWLPAACDLTGTTVSALWRPQYFGPESLSLTC